MVRTKIEGEINDALLLFEPLPENDYSLPDAVLDKTYAGDHILVVQNSSNEPVYLQTDTILGKVTAVAEVVTTASKRSKADRQKPYMAETRVCAPLGQRRRTEGSSYWSS
jgi:hypothetical protein